MEITVKELMDKDVWTQWCKLKNWKPTCVEDGIVAESDLVYLTRREAKKIGLDAAQGG